MRRRILILLCVSFFTFLNFSVTTFASSAARLYEPSELPKNNYYVDENFTSKVVSENILEDFNVNLSEDDLDMLIYALNLVGIENLKDLFVYLYQNNLLEKIPQDPQDAVCYLKEMIKDGSLPKEYGKTVDKIDIVYKLAKLYLY